MSKEILVHHSKTDWQKLDKMKDEEIDYSEIPELDDAFFENANFYMKQNELR